MLLKTVSRSLLNKQLVAATATKGASVHFLHVASKPSDLVGNTPLLDLGNILKAHGVDNGSRLYGKLESLGPCSSVKDRIGRSMIDEAEKQGLSTSIYFARVFALYMYSHHSFFFFACSHAWRHDARGTHVG
jgi:hypothetical protein